MCNMWFRLWCLITTYYTRTTLMKSMPRRFAITITTTIITLTTTSAIIMKIVILLITRKYTLHMNYALWKYTHHVFCLFDDYRPILVLSKYSCRCMLRSEHSHHHLHISHYTLLNHNHQHHHRILHLPTNKNNMKTIHSLM